MAVDGGGEGQDHLADNPVLHPRGQFVHPQGLRAAPVQRRQQAAQYVVAAAEGAAALQGPKAADLLDHADQGPVPAAVGADSAGVGGVQGAAGGAGAHLVRRLGHGQGEGA